MFGELVVESRFLALGNWENGRLMPGSFLTSGNDPTARVLHTGDLINLREDGLAEFVGRKDRVVKIRGKHVDLTEVEEVLRSVDYISDAAVVWQGHETSPRLIAYVASNASDATILLERLDTAFTRLPGHARPSQFRIVKSIPRLPSLKPDIQALASLETASLSLLGDPREMPFAKDAIDTTRVKLAVENAWAEVLDRNSFARNLPWDQAGGDSLKALRLWFYIEEALDIRLPLEELESGATPRELITAIENHAVASPAARGQDARPLVFFMPGLVGDEPSLASFRAALRGSLRFEVARYLSWREMCRTGPRFDLIIDNVVAQVIATFGENECVLAGYSFGGFVAWEVARRLMATGHRVAFVGLVDTWRQENLESESIRAIIRLTLLMPERLAVRLRALIIRLLTEMSGRVIHLLIKISAFPMLHALDRLVALFPVSIRFRLHSQLIASLRCTH
jgi:acyl carrier protein